MNNKNSEIEKKKYMKLTLKFKKLYHYMYLIDLDTSLN